MTGDPLTIVLALPLVVFVWQLIGASTTFSPVSGDRGSGLANLISIGFVALLFGGRSVPLNGWLVGAASVGLVGALVLFQWAR